MSQAQQVPVAAL